MFKAHLCPNRLQRTYEANRWCKCTLAHRGNATPQLLYFIWFFTYSCTLCQKDKSSWIIKPQFKIGRCVEVGCCWVGWWGELTFKEKNKCVGCFFPQKNHNCHYSVRQRALPVCGGWDGWRSVARLTSLGLFLWQTFVTLLRAVIDYWPPQQCHHSTRLRSPIQTPLFPHRRQEERHRATVWGTRVMKK